MLPPKIGEASISKTEYIYSNIGIQEAWYRMDRRLFHRFVSFIPLLSVTSTIVYCNLVLYLQFAQYFGYHIRHQTGDAPLLVRAAISNFQLAQGK